MLMANAARAAEDALWSWGSAAGTESWAAEEHQERREAETSEETACGWPERVILTGFTMVVSNSEFIFDSGVAGLLNGRPVWTAGKTSMCLSKDRKYVRGSNQQR